MEFKEGDRVRVKRIMGSSDAQVLATVGSVGILTEIDGEEYTIDTRPGYFYYKYELELISDGNQEEED